MRSRRRLAPLLSLLAVPACGAPEPGDQGSPPGEDTGGAQDIRATHLALDLGALSGRAALDVMPARGAEVVVLDVHGLTLGSVRVDDAAVTPELRDGAAHVPVRPDGGEVSIVVEYTFPARGGQEFDGWMPDFGVSFVWPYHCGNLFPCDPTLTDGARFSLDVTGYEAGLTAIYADAPTGEAPPYQPALAVGQYTRVPLGETTAGTRLSAWHLPEGAADTPQGTAHFVGAFDFLERTYGPYAFGPESGTVQVDWGVGSYGGMEHHPFVHVGKYDWWNEEVHVHEAAHGWFGAGVRLECWEDFVLSEGTVTYMTARALNAAGGDDLWQTYVNLFLGPICEGDQPNAIALPDTCGEIDIQTDPLWSLAPYMKGACFYEDVADLVGADVVDEVIGDFYVANVGEPARMREMLAALEARVSTEDAARIDRLADEWLRTLDCPADYAARCGRRDD